MNQILVISSATPIFHDLHKNTLDELWEWLCLLHFWYFVLYIWKGALLKQEKMFCISLRRLFSLLRYSDFNFSDIQMSWRHQVLKHETRNTFYWITWEVNTVWLWKLTSVCIIRKEIFLLKNHKKYGLETSSRPFSIFQFSNNPR